MRAFLAISLIASGLGLVSCTTNDPDLNPQATVPDSDTRKIPWNAPISGQGGGALGNLPQQQRR